MPNNTVRRQQRVGALVVNWNRKQETLECISSLFGSTYPALVVYVVDNGSTDGSAEAIAERYPIVRRIRSEENLGFAQGNNLGLAAMMADEIDLAFLVNNDVIVSHDALEWLVAGMRGYPDAGVFSPKVLLYSKPDVIWSAGGMLDPETGVAKQRHYGEKDVGQVETPCEVDYAVGCAMLVKMEAIRRAGLMDARYFMYYEEAEWCRRIHQAGYKIIYAPLSEVWHKVELDDESRNDSPYYFSRNRLLFLDTGGAPRKKIARVAVTDLLRTAVVHAAKGRLRRSRLMVRGLLDFYSGRFGRLGATRVWECGGMGVWEKEGSSPILPFFKER